jgi:DNA polymerase-3 subunit beta
MKFLVEKKSFLKSLCVFQTLTNKRLSHLKILNHVLISAKNNKIKMLALSMESTVICKIKGKVDVAGKIVFSTQKLRNILQNLPGFFVKIFTSKNNNYINIKSNLIKYKVPKINHDEFPPFLKKITEKKNKIAIISKKIFLNLVKKVSYAQSLNPIQKILNGICFEFNNDHIKLIATDGKKLAISTFYYNTDKKNLVCKKITNKNYLFVLPNRSIYELQRILKEECKIEIFSKKDKIVFNLINKEDKLNSSVDQISIIVKKTSDKYLNYDNILKKKFNLIVKVNKEDLQNCLIRSSIIADEKKTAVNLIFLKNKIVIKIESLKLEKFEEKIIISYQGPKISLFFDPFYLINTIRNLKNEKVGIYLEKGKKVLIIKSNLDNFLGVVMPIQMNKI